MSHSSLLKYQLLRDFQKDIQQLDSNIFELTKDEIQKANTLVQELYQELFLPKERRVVISYSPLKEVVNIQEKDKEYIEHIEALLRDFKIEDNKAPDKAFEILDEFIYKFKKEYSKFLDIVRFESYYTINTGLTSFTTIRATFDFELNLIEFKFDNIDYIEVINNRVTTYCDYHRAIRAYNFLLKSLKIELGFEAPVVTEKKEVIVKESYHSPIRTTKVTIKPDGYYSTRDLYSRSPKIAEFTDMKKALYEEYLEKVEEFDRWKRAFEEDLLNPALEYEPLEDIAKDDLVYFSNGQRMLKVKIINIINENNKVVFAYKIFNEESNRFLIKEHSVAIDLDEKLPFYKIQ